MEFLPYSNQVLFQKDIPFIGLRQVPHRFSLTKPYHFPNFPVEPFISTAPRKKQKVVFVVGSTGTGKSKLAIDLATRFDGEIVNSDKIQVHDGLNIITNKVTEEECSGIPHHLIGGVHPEADFTTNDFRREAIRAIESIITRGRLPIIAGGSNSYIEELVDGDTGTFRSKYETIFIWVDVELAVLYSYVSVRVDKMVEMGSVEEAREMFNPEGDYSRGIRRAIGVPEMDRYFRAEGSADEATKARLLETAMDDIKSNTCKLASRQLQKIRRLSTLPGWDMPRIDATEAFLKKGKQAEEAWERVARGPSVKIVQKFLHKDDTIQNINGTVAGAGAAAMIGVNAADTATTNVLASAANTTTTMMTTTCEKCSAHTSAAAAASDANSGMSVIRTSNYCGSAASTAAASATATVGSTH